MLVYWDAAAPLLDHHRQAFADARRDTQHARQLRREGAIRTLMQSTWVWHVAGEDFKQRQLHAYPLRAVLDAIAAAHASHDAHLELCLKDAAATLCRAQQRALVFHEDNPYLFTFTEDNAVVKYTAQAQKR